MVLLHPAGRVFTSDWPITSFIWLSLERISFSRPFDRKFWLNSKSILIDIPYKSIFRTSQNWVPFLQGVLVKEIVPHDKLERWHCVQCVYTMKPIRVPFGPNRFYYVQCFIEYILPVLLQWVFYVELYNIAFEISRYGLMIDYNLWIERSSVQ